MTKQPRRRRRFQAPKLVERTGVRIGIRRIRWVLVVYLLVVAITAGKLVEIQVVNADAYSDRSVQQRARTLDLAATRGRIYDREGDVLATSVQSATIYADPRAFRPTETSEGTEVPAGEDVNAVAEQLAPHLELNAEQIVERLERDAHFVYLGRQLEHEVGEAITELDLEGIGVLSEPHRVYPGSDLAAQVIGFTGIDGEGLQGLEARYDSVLSGSSGMLVFEQAPDGLDIASGVRELVPPEAGTDLVLTLDREIQHVAAQAAADAVEEHNAAGASVIVMDTQSFDVLGMASVPSYDPNERDEGDEANWRNRAVTDVFEPGSTQKALTVAAALEEGLVTADSSRPVSTSVNVGGRDFRDPSPFGGDSWTVTDIMERSSNVGTIEMAQELGPERLEQYLRDFGYGVPTSSGFPGEASGLLMPHEDWWGTSLPTISIGQGVAVTLLQLATAYATLANDGTALDPKIVRGTVGDDGRLTPASTGDERQVVSPDSAAQVRDMLEVAVAGESGTGNLAQIDGYKVAGKTGTARKPSADARGYSGEYVATFVGMAPADDPRIVVAVMLDEPDVYYGGVVAAPLFQEIMSSALISMRIPPEGEGQSLDEAIVAAAEARAEAAAAAEAAEMDPDDPTSPPVGMPAGGDGAPVGDGADSESATSTEDDAESDEADNAEDADAGGDGESGEVNDGDGEPSVEAGTFVEQP